MAATCRGGPGDVEGRLKRSEEVFDGGRGGNGSETELLMRCWGRVRGDLKRDLEGDEGIDVGVGLTLKLGCLSPAIGKRKGMVVMQWEVGSRCR